MKQASLSIRNISKCYRLGTIGRHTLVDEARYWWHKVCRRDPRQYFSKIGHTATEARKVQAEHEGAESFWALKDITFEVSPGEVIGVIGGNGAGKSTLLKILTRITEPTSGEAFINGRVASLLEVGTGFHPELTGRENVYMNGTILGMKRREIARKFDEIVAFSELEKFIDTPVKRYSSGMYVRLAFAVAAHLDSEVLLIDEVLAVGDATFQNRCIGKMGEITREGRTVLFVSHNMGAIRSLCRACVLIHGGRMEYMGEVDTAIQRYLQQAVADKDEDDVARFSETTARGGHGGVRLQAFSARSSTEIASLRSGSAAVFAASYEVTAGSSPQKLNLGIGVSDALGTGVFLCSNAMKGMEFTNIPERGKIICRIPSLPLVPGSYRVTLKLMDDNGVADYIENATGFNVYNSGDSTIRLFGSQRWGSVFVSHDWDLSREGI